jgi:hypothetical protein
MPFTVVWLPSALNELAVLWAEATDRQAVTDAADRIDRTLRQRPLTVGRPHDGHRHYSDSPLVVVYEAIPDDCLVRVARVVRISR